MYLLRPCLGALWLFVLSLFLLGCGGGSKQPGGESSLPLVLIAKAVQGDVLDFEEFTGRTEAPESVEIKARATGYLDKVLFKDGDLVEKNQVLYEIDDRLYAAEVKNAQAAIDRAQASVERYNADLGRARRMRVGDAISREDYDKIVSQKDESAASVAANQAVLEKAKLNFSFCKVRAPIKGVISNTRISAGNLVTADQTSLTTIVVESPIYAYFDIDERTVLRIMQMIREEVSPAGIQMIDESLQKQKKVDDATRKKAVGLFSGKVTPETRKAITQLLANKVSEQDLEALFKIARDSPKFKSHRDTDVLVELGTQIEKGYPHQGKIDFVDNQLNATTGTLRVRGIFANKSGILRPRMFARIRLPIGDTHRAVLVSDSAIETDLNRKFLFTVVDDEVQALPIQTGPMWNGLRVIESGVEPGQWIVVSGQQFVRPGSKVRTKEVDMPRAEGAEAAAPVPPPVIKKK